VGEAKVIDARAVVALIVALACVSAMGADVTCEPPTGFGPRGWVESNGVVVIYRTEPPAIEIGQVFKVEAIVCVKDSAVKATGLKVDAVMPNHRHGMNYRPQVSAQGDSRYLAEGLLFHMPGRWRFLFDVDVPGRTEHLWQDIELE
jgi:hypothetical protein